MDIVVTKEEHEELKNVITLVKYFDLNEQQTAFIYLQGFQAGAMKSKFKDQEESFEGGMP